MTGARVGESGAGNLVKEADLELWSESAPALDSPGRDEPESVACVLVTQGWPRGVCPVHMMEPDVHCSSFCKPARIALAMLQEDYDEHWRTVAINLRWDREVVA